LKLNCILQAAKYLQHNCTEVNNFKENCIWSACKEICCICGAW